MKLDSFFRRCSLLSLFFMFVIVMTACRQASSEITSSSAPTWGENGELKQLPKDKYIAINFAKLLELRHVSKGKIDETISERAFGLYLKALDPTKLYFNKSDISEFEAKYKKNLALLFKKGNMGPAFEIYNLYVKRVEERSALLQQILDSKLDFNQDEYIIRDKKLLDYANSDVEVMDRLRKKVKFDILYLEGDKREENKEKAQKTEEGKNPKPEVAKEKKSGNDESPIERLHRRYSSIPKRIHQTTNDDVLEMSLTAVANSFDPHSTYMSPKTYENFMIQMRLNLDGIGATLGWEDGYTIVKSLVKGGAAEKQGELKVEDKIISVAQGEDGTFEDVVDMNLNDVVSKIRGKRGTVVRLEVQRNGSKKVIRIVREKIELEDSAAQGKVFDAGKKADGTPYKIGVIDLPSFYADMEARSKGDSNGRSTTKDVRRILREFVAANADACVIDLRFNGGGSLQEVVDLVGLFIETGTVVQVAPSEYGLNRPRQLNDRDSSIEWGRPLAVITSKFSASASEIFAGAIKDYGRGIIIGDETTHGKGTVQPLIELSEILFGPFSQKDNFGVLKVSIQGFYLPHGESTQLIGVRSDIQLPSITNELDGTEADSDYPLSFEKIEPAAVYPKFNYVSPQLIDALKARSNSRINGSSEFKRVMKNIKIYREIKDSKKTPLNRAKYFTELDRLNMDKSEEKEYEKLMNGEQKIIRDYYLGEVLDITADYLGLLNDNKTVFEKEKTGYDQDIFKMFR